MRGLAPCLAVSALALATSFATGAHAEPPPLAPSATSPPLAPPATSPPATSAAPATATTAPGAGGATQLPPSSSVPTYRRWYGGGIIAADILSTLMLPLLAAETSSGAIAGISVVGYVAGGPAIHALNGARPAVIGGSVALRLGLPLAGLLIGVAIGESSDSSCSSEGDDALCGLAAALDGIFAMLIGMVTASVIDSAALAWTSAKPDAMTHPAPAQSLRLVPILGLRRDDLRRNDARRDDARAIAPTFGVAGTF